MYYIIGLTVHGIGTRAGWQARDSIRMIVIIMIAWLLLLIPFTIYADDDDTQVKCLGVYYVPAVIIALSGLIKLRCRYATRVLTYGIIGGVVGTIDFLLPLLPTSIAPLYITSSLGRLLDAVIYVPLVTRLMAALDTPEYAAVCTLPLSSKHA
jgi:sulfite exporter TauE/SafE